MLLYRKFRVEVLSWVYDEEHDFLFYGFLYGFLWRVFLCRLLLSEFSKHATRKREFGAKTYGQGSGSAGGGGEQQRGMILFSAVSAADFQAAKKKAANSFLRHFAVFRLSTELIQFLI